MADGAAEAVVAAWVLEQLSNAVPAMTMPHTMSTANRFVFGVRLWMLAAIFILYAACGGAARAASITISDLHGICGSKDPANSVACRFFILGAAEAAEVTWQEDGAAPLFCISNTVTFAELAAKVENDVSANIASHPEIAPLSATSSVITALGKLYPCHV